jgi:signal transduction histidine kinase
VDPLDRNFESLILVVDDDPVVRSLMRAALEADGFAVAEAGDGVEACRAFDEGRPELLVVDGVMPVMDGFALCRELRARPPSAYVPILMATGLDDVASIRRAYEAGATDFIAKPINWVILSHRIRYMLRASRAFAELRLNQQHLLAAKEAAEVADRAKTEFLANMSHELRTPLNAIIGFSSILSDCTFGPLSVRYVEYAKLICDSGGHLLSIINDILEIAKAEASHLTLAEEEVDIAAIAALGSRMIEEMARKAEIDFHLAIADGLPTLYADPDKLRRILSNLLSNAVKFTPSGGAVTLWATCDAEGLVFRIEDTGIGIPPDKIAIALAPFGQVDGGLARKYDGVGLGLPLTKRLVELHGGTLEIASAPGQGTVVSARFPPSRICRGAVAPSARRLADERMG